MICDNCGKKGAKVRKITCSYGKGKKLLFIENVPVISCPHCGESYLKSETLHEIEGLADPVGEGPPLLVGESSLARIRMPA